jgi:hypothetical protein
MGAHLIDGEFQSDKYPTTPRGKVPLSVKDKTAQDLLWEYAQRRRAVDAEFSDDLEAALRAHGFDLKMREPSSSHPENKPGQTYDVNDRRRVAALKACDGLPTEALEHGVIKELYSLAALMVVHDKMAERRDGSVVISEAIWQTHIRAAIDRLNEACEIKH